MSNLTPKSSNSFFDQFERFVRDPLAPVRNFVSDNMLNVDVKDDGDVYTIEADLPGVEREDIKLTMEEDMLNISIEKKQESDEEKEDGRYIRRERFYSSSSRSIRLPLALPDGEVHARLADGVLEVTVPKTNDKPETTKQIEIK